MSADRWPLDMPAEIREAAERQMMLHGTAAVLFEADEQGVIQCRLLSSSDVHRPNENTVWISPEAQRFMKQQDEVMALTLFKDPSHV